MCHYTSCYNTFLRLLYALLRKHYHGPCKTIDVEDECEILDGIEHQHIDAELSEKS